MAFRSFFSSELNQLIGDTVEVATDNNLIEGVLISVQTEVIRVVETIVGYAPTTHVLLIPIESINFVRLVSKP